MQNTEFRTGVIRPVECFKEGWELIKDQYWLFFAIVLVGMLIGGLIPLGIGIGAMFCGIYYCLFQKMNNRKVEFEGLFKGFSYFVPGLVATLVLIVPAVISVLFVYASMLAVFFASMDSRGRINETAIWGLMGTMFVEMIAIWLIIGSLHVFLMFSYPLIVEKNMSGWAAFKLSARAGWANLSGVVGLILIEFLLGLASYVFTFFLLGFGVYLVMPLMFAGVLVAYRKVFPATESFPPAENFPPPPPHAF
ncbi:MAG TPA: hypothetical protein VF604_03080 [Pyrinomonadaceae bacterium]|jgi:hypothetical protein